MQQPAIDEVLKFLNATSTRATYKAVGDAIGVNPRTMARTLGEKRPEASWVVNADTKQPTGYAPHQIDPRLEERDAIFSSAGELLEALRDWQAKQEVVQEAT